VLSSTCSPGSGVSLLTSSSSPEAARRAAVRRVPVLVASGLLAATLLGGCAQAPEGAADATPGTTTPGTTTADAGSAGSASPTTPATTPPPTGDEERVVEVSVTGRTVTPAPDQLDLAVGETLVLEVTADVDTQIHAHGFEVETDVPAGVPTRIELTGTAPGVYEVELHHPDLLLVQVAVR
jgi:hypothetical protein